MTFNTILILCTVAYFAIIFIIGLRQTKQAQESFDSYAVANKTMPGFVIAITFIASALGAGDMISNADSGYVYGISWLFWVLGEQFGKIFFALVCAGFIAKFSFKTIADFVESLMLSDKTTKIIIGIVTTLPGIAWCAAQSMALGGVFHVFTGLDATPLIIGSTVIFIIYTAMGGIRASIKTDMVQGVLVIIFGLVYYIAIMDKFDFSIETLKTMADAVNPALFDLSNFSVGTLLSKFVTSFLSLSVLHYYWQRLFSCKSSRSARNSFLAMAIATLVVCTLTNLTGIYAAVAVPGLENGVVAALVQKVLPKGIQLIFVIAIIAACVSTAQAMLNSAAVILVNDVVKPCKPDLTDKQMVKLVTILTFVVGILSLTLSMSFTLILDMIGVIYSGCCGVMAPLLAVGLIWRKDKSKPFSADNCGITKAGAITGLVGGIIIGVTFSVVPALSSIMGGGIFPALIFSTLCYVVISKLTADKKAIAAE